MWRCFPVRACVSVDLPVEALRRRDVTAAGQRPGGDGSTVRLRQGQPDEGGGGDERDARKSGAFFG